MYQQAQKNSFILLKQTSLHARSTMEIAWVPKDSGVPISARFCFYDQIHTTGTP